MTLNHRIEGAYTSLEDLLDAARLSGARGQAPLYRVIYADPPWSYKNGAGLRGRAEDHYDTAKPSKSQGAASAQYDLMSNADIARLPIGDLAAPNCVLLLWATNPLLREALAVCEAWGFDYRTNFCWDKQHPGCGFYSRSEHELLFVAVRGKGMVPERTKTQSSIIRSRRREHSRKPELHGWIEDQYGGPYLELFARQRVPGWTCMGNQVDRFEVQRSLFAGQGGAA